GEEPWTAPRQFSLADEPWYAEFANSARVKTFMVLEWVSGTTLEEVFRLPPASRPSVPTLTEWFLQAANALQAVPAGGLAHRDVKPGTLRGTAEGALKLMDSGIARNQADVRTIMTATGRAVGTPAYMSPEQLREGDGEAGVGPATDVYSLAATFYELYTGTRCFGHATESAASVRTWKLGGRLPDRFRKPARGLPSALPTLPA